MIRLITLLLFFSLSASAQFIGNPNIMFPAGGYSTEAQAAIDELNTEPPTAYKDAISVLVDNLVTIGDWDQFDVFVLFNLDTEPNSLKDLSGNNFDVTEVGSITWTATVGWKGTTSGTNGLNSNYNPTDDGINVAQTDIMAGAWVVNPDSRSSESHRRVFAVKNVAGVTLEITDKRGNQALQGKIYSTAVASIAATDLVGGELMIIVRDGTVNELIIADGGTDLDTNASSTPSGEVDIDIYILSKNEEGTLLVPSDAELMCWFVGKGSTIDRGNLKTALSTFKTAIDAI